MVAVARNDGGLHEAEDDHAQQVEDIEGPSQVSSIEDAHHHNSRCVCKCPDVEAFRQDFNRDFFPIQGTEKRRSVYVNSTVTPKMCNCEQVVLNLLNLTPSEADGFCPRCKCNFEVRNLSIMKVVVILVIWVICILVIYMGFLTCLEPMMSRKLPSINYREHHDTPETEEEDVETAEHLANGTPMRTYGSSVINRMENQQTRWKRQVEEQRRNIYDRHSMLN
eukprot:snap_masked-scaffold713_size108309-processed-gene-0.6 protein:Tk04839 transcript:snap_masked-scaffold713_size108309-processed-gene-0.6-mRNA-1 annotation:"transmembrane protein 9 precursor"